MQAASKGQSVEVSRLLRGGADVHTVDSTKWGARSTTLHCGVAANDVETIEVLLKAGVDPNKADQYGETPLMKAARSSKLKVIECLLRAGSDKNAVANDGRTALDFAQEKLRSFDLSSSLSSGSDSGGSSSSSPGSVQQALALAEKCLELLQ